MLLYIVPVQGQGDLVPENLFEEYSLKAAFALNFSRLTRWPDDSDEHINFCIMGNHTVQNAFKIVNNQSINNKISQLRIINRDKEITGCQILFITGISHNNLRKLYSSARNHPILTISEVEDISRSGAIINFVKNADKIRFQVNVKNTQQAGLKISSRLLKLAIIPHQE